MKIIDSIPGLPHQTMNLVTEDGKRISFSLNYLPTQQAWFFDFTFGNITARGMQLAYGANILQNYRHTLPFGLACLSADGLDPTYLTDFSSGRVKLYLLNSAEVDAVQQAISA